MLRISCLHSADSNIAVFESARRQLRLDDVMLRHRVRADLLAAAESGLNLDRVLLRTGEELVALSRNADAVLLTCSTLGPAAAIAAQRTSVPVMRVDEALAAAATRAGGVVVVLCAAGATIAPTRALFERAALGTGASLEVRLVPGAWDSFKAGDHAGYQRLLIEAADGAAREGATTVAFAQASMAAAATACSIARPLVSPTAGLGAAVAVAQAAAEKSSKQS